MELILIRHGESESNAGLSTSKDSTLTPLGLDQAARAIPPLTGAGIERLYCSAMQRALQTAAVLGGGLGLRPHVWTQLSEHGLCWAESGLSRSEIVRRFPLAILPPEVDEEGWARHWPGETWEESSARMAGVAAEVRRLAGENNLKRIAMIIHGGSGSLLIGHLMGVAPDAGVRLFDHGNCGITRLDLREDGAIILRSLNDRHHMNGLPDSSREAAG